MRFLTFLGLAIAAMTLWTSNVSAATLQLIADKPVANVGDSLTITISVNTENVGVNAAEATLQFPKELVEVVSIDKSDSIFNFWVDGPRFSNENGLVVFTGGSTNGFVGQSLPIARVTFKVKKAGVTDFIFTEGAVTASDGDGTNVLSAMHNLSITNQELPEVKPVQIIRKAVPAAKVPATPKVEVTLYPDPEKWHNLLSSFLVRWELPADVTDVTTLLNQNPKSNPQTSEGLFDNKLFRISEDGVWYIHVRFKNNVGWSDTRHYRIAVDTLPPAVFEVLVAQGTTTDVPNPKISFASHDQFSGIKNYRIRVDGDEPFETEANEIDLPLLKPGIHTIRVAAVDNAENRTETSIDLTILPITAPTISPLAKEVYIGEGELSVGGSVLQQGVMVFAVLKRENGEQVASTTAVPDANGVWTARFDQPLKKGRYLIEVTAKDERGALSLPVTTTVFEATRRPFLVIAGLAISETVVFLFVILLLASGYVAGWYIEKVQRRKRLYRAIIAQRDVANACQKVIENIEFIVKKYADRHELLESEVLETISMLERAKKNMPKIQEYILNNIADITKK